MALLGSSIVLMAIAATMVTANDEREQIRRQEGALAQSLRTPSKDALLRLTASGFSLHLTCGNAVHDFATDVHRDEWIDSLIGLRIDSYRAVVSRIHLGRGPSAIVTLNEFWTVRSPRGNRIDRRLLTIDVWVGTQGIWTLSSRNSWLNCEGVTGGYSERW
jgi:hypothetical protein